MLVLVLSFIMYKYPSKLLKPVKWPYASKIKSSIASRICQSDQKKNLLEKMLGKSKNMYKK
ncbi:MAG: hypothetical protein A2749_00615 [Parcubacteria group bacterium RIFCSPHIGHO2_01_FULL_45_26]|nr:MAG: hypothetical protein A2749_00615 [Parcubacteria group bacterium RIFCSPHIGHO2_01_FULL_45_26]